MSDSAKQVQAIHVGGKRDGEVEVVNENDPRARSWKSDGETTFYIIAPRSMNTSTILGKLISHYSKR